MLKRLVCWSLLWIAATGLSGCAAVARGGAAEAVSKPQSDAEIQEIMRGLKPTERVVANADARMLWQATSGYMQRAFPLDELPQNVAEGQGGARQLRTQLVEWSADGMPHRTRVFVEMRPDPANAANVRLRVTALQVEAEPQLAQARQGEPLQYAWRLVGGNPRVEETVADQILNRYEALRAGRPLPLEEELLVPIRRES